MLVVTHIENFEATLNGPVVPLVWSCKIRRRMPSLWGTTPRRMQPLRAPVPLTRLREFPFIIMVGIRAFAGSAPEAGRLQRPEPRYRHPNANPGALPAIDHLWTGPSAP
jgi:hypothetical protein